MASIPSLLRVAQNIITKNSPTILTAVGVAGVVSTAVLAVKATPQAMAKIDEAQVQKALAHEEAEQSGNAVAANRDLTVAEKIKASYLCYIPAAAVATVTIVCIIAGNRISVRRQAALLGLYEITERGFREYQEKVTEQIGKQKEQAVRDDIAIQHMKDNPVDNREIIIASGGDVLFMDDWSNRYFKSDMETVRQAVNDVNEECMNMGYVSLNDFYSKIGLPKNGSGDETGWSAPDNLLKVQYTTGLSEDSKPCIIIKFDQYPGRGYYLLSHD